MQVICRIQVQQCNIHSQFSIFIELSIFIVTNNMCQTFTIDARSFQEIWRMLCVSLPLPLLSINSIPFLHWACRGM